MESWNLKGSLENGIGISLLKDLRPMREHATMHRDAYCILISGQKVQF